MTQLITTTTSNPPFLVNSTLMVSNLNTQFFNYKPQSYYLDVNNIESGILNVIYGGTGDSMFTASNILFGNGIGPLLTNPLLFWDNSNNRLGVGTSNPSYTIDCTGIINSY